MEVQWKLYLKDPPKSDCVLVTSMQWAI